MMTNPDVVMVGLIPEQAALLAAAPKLLEFLRKTAKALHEADAHGDYFHCCDQETCIEIQLIIDKAEGK